MKNVLDIKEEKNLNFVLPKKNSKEEVDFSKQKCAVLIHLYYIDTIEFYMNYVKNIPEEIDVIFTYSDERLKDKIIGCLKGKRKNYIFVEKENRGRDISALLVAGREVIMQYEYICFLHDKKEKNEMRKKDNSEWVYSLWENMISSKEYITNIIHLFQEKKELGLLVPPLLINKQVSHAYVNHWLNNFDVTKKLAYDLNIKSDIDSKKSPITLGTVFWCKTDAVRKMLEKQWKYEDFDDEPRKDDGTISHAVERILAFLAQDAGYETAWVMTDEYASKYMQKMLYGLEKSFDLLNDYLGITMTTEICAYKEEEKKLKKFLENKKDIYIYGTGVYGDFCYKIIRNLDLNPTAFIVSDRKDMDETFHNLKVCSIKDVSIGEKDGLIIAVSYKYREEILKNLEQKRKENINPYVFGYMIENNRKLDNEYS